MPLTKRQISDLVADLEAGGDPTVDSKFHRDNIQALTEVVRNTLIELDYNQRRNEGQFDINGDFIKPFPNQEVLFDSDRDEYYTVMPSKYASLPNNRGIRMVSQMKNQKNEFIKLNAGSQFVFCELEAGSLNGRTGYYPEGERIYYQNIDGVHVKKVLIKLVPALDSLDEDEVIPIPAGLEKNLIDGVREMLAETKITPQDKINDSNND